MTLIRRQQKRSRHLSFITIFLLLYVPLFLKNNLFFRVRDICTVGDNCLDLSVPQYRNTSFLLFWRASVSWPLLCLCRPFCIFERCLDSNPESCSNAYFIYMEYNIISCLFLYLGCAHTHLIYPRNLVNGPVNIIYIISVTNTYYTWYTEASIYVHYIYNSVHRICTVQVLDIYLCTLFLEKIHKEGWGKITANVLYKLNFKIKIVVFSWCTFENVVCM
jgi:hypothetical protein